MAAERSRGAGALLVIALILAIGGGGYWYWGELKLQRADVARAKIALLLSTTSSVGQSYARTLAATDSLRDIFRQLVDENPNAPASQLRTLADRATTTLIDESGLATDIDRVVAHVAGIETCILDRACDVTVATGADSPCQALAHWEQWFRPYFQTQPGTASTQGFYSYIRRSAQAGEVGV